MSSASIETNNIEPNNSYGPSNLKSNRIKYATIIIVIIGVVGAIFLGLSLGDKLQPVLFKDISLIAGGVTLGIGIVALGCIWKAYRSNSFQLPPPPLPSPSSTDSLAQQPSTLSTNSSSSSLRPTIATPTPNNVSVSSSSSSSSVSSAIVTPTPNNVSVSSSSSSSSVSSAIVTSQPPHPIASPIPVSSSSSSSSVSSAIVTSAPRNVDASLNFSLPLGRDLYQQALNQLGWQRLNANSFVSPNKNKFLLNEFLIHNLNEDCIFSGCLKDELLILTPADFDAVIELAKIDCSPELYKKLCEHKQKLIHLKTIFCENLGFGKYPHILEMLSLASVVIAKPETFGDSQEKEKDLNRALCLGDILAHLKNPALKIPKAVLNFPGSSPLEVQATAELFAGAGINFSRAKSYYPHVQQSHRQYILMLLPLITSLLRADTCINDKGQYAIAALIYEGLYLVQCQYENNQCLSDKNPNISAWGNFALIHLIPRLTQQQQRLQKEHKSNQ